MQCQIGLADKRPTKPEGFRVILAFLITDVRIGEILDAGTNKCAARVDSDCRPAFFLSCRFRPSNLKAGTNQTGSDWPFLTGNKVKPRVKPSGAFVKARAKVLNLHPQDIERVWARAKFLGGLGKAKHKQIGQNRQNKNVHITV